MHACTSSTHSHPTPLRARNNPWPGDKIGKMHTMSSGNKCYRKKKNIGVNTSVGMVVLRRVVTEGPSVKDHRSRGLDKAIGPCRCLGKEHFK